MVELAHTTADAAWKIRNLDDFDERLERAALAVDRMFGGREAALVIYEAALMRGGRSPEEVRELVDRFRSLHSDDEDPLTIPRVSGLLNVGGDEWFFSDPELRTLAGQLLGQFQHRVAQYNYVAEGEVLKRWADSYDTRLFIRRRIYDTEPVVGVVAGFDLALMQRLRVAAGGDTLIPSGGVSKALVSLGLDEPADGYETLASGEGVALRLDLPAPVVGEILEEISREGKTDFPEPPAEPEEEKPEEGEPEKGETEKGETEDGDAERSEEGRDESRGESPETE